MTQYQRDKLDEMRKWAGNRVVKPGFFLPGPNNAHDSWMVSLLLQMLASRLFVPEADLNLYLEGNNLPEAPLNRRGFFIAEALLYHIHRPTLTCFDRIHALEQELLLELGRPLAGNKLIFLWDFAKQYPIIPSFETWAENVKSSLRPQKPFSNATGLSIGPEAPQSELRQSKVLQSEVARAGEPFAHNFEETLKATA